MAGLSQVAERQAGEAAPVDQVEIDALMRRFLDESRPNSAGPKTLEVVSIDTPNVQPRRDFDKAVDLLERAEQAFGLLINRCQILEHNLEDETERARARETEQDEAIEQWRRLASGLKAQLDSSDQAAAALKAHSDASEARAVAAEQKLAALERASARAAEQAALADRVSTKLHDKVVTAFGIGSRAHPVLEAVATRPAAE